MKAKDLCKEIQKKKESKEELQAVLKYIKDFALTNKSSKVTFYQARDQYFYISTETPGYEYFRHTLFNITTELEKLGYKINKINTRIAINEIEEVKKELIGYTFFSLFPVYKKTKVVNEEKSYYKYYIDYEVDICCNEETK